MKKVILLALLLPYPAFGQVAENFESGSMVNWTENTPGHWKADTASSLSGRFSLHHVFDNPDAGTDCIGLIINDLHPSQGSTQWSFIIRYGYEPSSLNNWSVFLMSDNDPVSMSVFGKVRGFALGVNLTGSDDTLRLWKVDGSNIIPVVDSGINWQTDIGTAVSAGVSVERSKEGIWVVKVKRNGIVAGTGTGSDIELFKPSWFGVYYKYTSTHDRQIWFDDLTINGTFNKDNEPPFIKACRPVGKKAVEIILNEEADNGQMLPDNILLNGQENKPVSLIKRNSLSWLAEFENELINKSVNTLIIKKICDISGNCTQDARFEFTLVWAETGDIIISEIMADPLPEVSLPDKEYIELTNRTQLPVNLKNWKLSVTGLSSVFPEIVIPPSGIFIICSQSDTLIFSKYGKTVGLKQFPALTDAGKLLILSDSIGTIIHGVDYSSHWYRDELKAQGGWSLEMIDMQYPFYDQQNWRASISRYGGTPGSSNSVAESNPDIAFSGILNVFPADSNEINVVFSEPVFSLADKKTSVRIGAMSLAGIFPRDPLFRKFSLKPENQMKKIELYHLEIPDDVTDFAGNRIERREFDFGLAQQAEPGDVLFNEILFNPLPGDPDYIELYNCSEKIIDASRLQIVSLNDATGEKSESIPVSVEPRCFLPDHYYAVTTDSKKTSERYFSADLLHLFEVNSLPSMADDKGHLILFTRELDKIDELIYDDDMHYSLLSTHDGVSLEKKNPAAGSEEKANWHSATQSSGWGTPGAKNSVYDEMTQVNDEIALSTTRITPDNDGNDDFLTISFRLNGTGNVLSVMIYDETGSSVRKLASNLYAGPETSLIWDGTADDGSPVRTGIYIVLITRYNDAGKTSQWKKVCTVVRK